MLNRHSMELNYSTVASNKETDLEVADSDSLGIHFSKKKHGSMSYFTTTLCFHFFLIESSGWS
ncbi:hypothetical protein DSUL_50337 [Desulfovibrionales bacterium]